MPNHQKQNGTQSEELRVGHLNICSLAKKVPDLSVFLNQNPYFHIFGVSESRLKTKIDDRTISIPNFTHFRKDAAAPLQTGLITYVHSSLANNVKRREDLESTKVESLWLELKTPKSSSILIGYVYRNPTSRDDWYEEFIAMMDKASRNRCDIFLLGDFNLNLLKSKVSDSEWNSMTSQFGLTQVISSPTRVDHRTSTLIDHIYTTNSGRIKREWVPDLAISDHSAVCCAIAMKLGKLKKKKHTTITYRSFKNFDEEKFQQDLQNAPFYMVYNHTCPDQAMACWIDIYQEVLNQNAPLRTKRVKHDSLPPWLTIDIRSAMALRDKLKKEKKFDEYKKQRNLVKYLVRAAKKSYFNKMIENNKDTASLWRALNSVTKGKVAPEIPDHLTAESFNKHFISSVETLAQSMSSASDFKISEHLGKLSAEKQISEQFAIPYITVAEVAKLIQDMPNKKSTGTDNIDNRTLKLSLPYTVDTLTYIYNLCIDKQVFPHAMKEAKVIPIPKSKDLNDMNNYRPISLLSALSKPLERHVHKHLTDFLEKNKLLYVNQSGFRENHSCQTALSHIIDSWLEAINNTQMTGAVFLDLKKAFDLVNHEILLKKLTAYHIGEKSITFLKSYLSDRKQKVFIHGQYSPEANVHFGVPQGSILGPLLFVLYINDLPLHISDKRVNCNLFADDTSMHVAGKNTSEISVCLQKSLDEVGDWCQNNHMILHPGKTKSMLITTRQKHQLCPQPLQLNLNSQSIEQVKERKFLGLNVDQQLSWETHINEVCKKISKNVYLLSQLRHVTDMHARKMFFYAHIKSHIDYVSTVWDGSREVHINSLNSYYKRAIKLIDSSPISTAEKMQNLNILGLHEQLIYNKCILLHKIFNGNAPEYLTTPFEMQAANQRQSRNNIVALPLPRIDLYKSSLLFSGISLWNLLPQQLKSISSMTRFKSNLRQHLKSNNLTLSSSC